MRASLSFFIVALACSSAERRASAPEQPAPARPRARVVWARFAEIQSLPAVGAPVPNSGHVGAGAFAIVHISPEARSAYEHWVQDSELASGSVVALFHEQASGRPGPVYIMEKTGGAWQFMTCRADGTDCGPADATNATTARGCRRCHADAVADSLFGLPRRAAAAP